MEEFRNEVGFGSVHTHINKGFTSTKIGWKLNVKPNTINYWLRRQGVIRTYKEAQQLRRSREHEVAV